jgi:hypothetical protein
MASVSQIDIFTNHKLCFRNKSIQEVENYENAE